MRRIFSRMTAGERAFAIVNIFIMLIIVIVTLYPFLNVLALSLNDSNDSIKGGITIFPREFTLKNFETILQYQSLGIAFFNSTLRTILGTFLAVLASAILAYALSRKEFKARKFASAFMAITMYVSAGLIPFFLLIRDLQMLDTFSVYILPGVVGAFNVIMVRSFIDELPAELWESAHIDGAGHWTILFRIIIPLCKPVLATIALFVAVGQWNSWFDTYLFNGSTPDLTTLQFELQKILQSTNQRAGADAMRMSQNMVEMARQVSPESVKMAITIVTTIPILIVYPFLQRYFVSGMTLGAVKG